MNTTTRNVAISLSLALALTRADASKSAEDCEAELGESSSRAQVAACILDSMSDQNLTAPAPSKDFFVQRFGIHHINSVGGVEPFAQLANAHGHSAIKYLHIETTVYNGVGDTIRSSLGAAATQWLRFTGPLEPSTQTTVYWEPVWYNATARCLKIRTVTIEFMNGRKRSFTGKTLRAALDPSIENACPPSTTQTDH